MRGEDLTTEERSREQWETRGGCHGLGPDEREQAAALDCLHRAVVDAKDQDRKHPLSPKVLAILIPRIIHAPAHGRRASSL